MNILLICSEFPPFSLGGVSVHANQLSKKISNESKDNKVVVVTLNNDSNKTEIDVEHSENEIIVRVNIYGKVSDINSDEEQFIIQNTILKKGIDFLLKNNLISDINLITLHGHFMAEVALYAKDILGVPLVYHAHSTYSFDMIETDKDSPLCLIGSLEKQICMDSDYIVVVSLYLKKLMVQYFNINDDKIVIIGKGIDIEAYDRVKVDKVWEDYRILFVGRISPEKGIEVLLMALRLLSRKSNFKPQLYIIGCAIEQSYLDEVNVTINKLSLNKQVIFLGSKKQSEIIKEFKSCDLVVVPSHNETFGRVAIEAMAAKVPVVVSNVGGLGPLVEDTVTGFKFDDGDYIGLMQKIYFASTNEHNCKNIVDNAYKYVCDLYTLDNIYAKTMNVYMKVIGG